MNDGNSDYNNRTNANRVRPVCSCSSADGPVTYDIRFDSIVEAFEDCVRQKRSSKDCLTFSGVYESELVRLWNELSKGVYQPGRSSCFVVKWPVYREIIAANFADRVIHHWWTQRVNPLFEKRFVAQGNVSKNCRKGEGTLSAVKAVAAMVDAHPTWWVGKFDFEGFFMNINKAVLWEMLDIFIRDNYKDPDLEAVLYVTRRIIFHLPTKNYILKSSPALWKHIPPSKTFFGHPEGTGCAPGNLPSQLLANFYASVFDEWIQAQGVRNYVRFVDDFVILLPSKDQILHLIPSIRKFLDEQLCIRLHPKKIYVQPVRNGLLYVGAYIRPGRTYISNRTRSRFLERLHHFNRLAEEGKAFENLEPFVASINSYLGMMVHHKSYNIRHRLLRGLHPAWWQFITIDGHIEKLRIKKRYRQHELWRQAAKDGSYAKVLMPEFF